MSHLTKICSILCLAGIVAGCNRPVMETVLNGYDQGKRTMKMEFRFFNESLENGAKGYRLETLVHFAIGNRATLKRVRTTWLDKDFNLVKSEVENQENADISHTKTWVDGGKIHIETTGPDGKVNSQQLDHQGPVLLELHPLVYTHDLKIPGSTKTYPVLYEDEARVVPLEVKFLGPETLYEENQATPSLHYQIQAITSPDEYDDYYLDPKTRNIQKIQFGLIKFVPAT